MSLRLAWPWTRTTSVLAPLRIPLAGNSNGRCAPVWEPILSPLSHTVALVFTDSKRIRHAVASPSEGGVKRSRYHWTRDNSLRCEKSRALKALGMETARQGPPRARAVLQAWLRR